jgi:N6-adenosine-specific RNA methylase IME4
MGAAAKFYDLIVDDNIVDIANPVPYMNDKSVLFMWATGPRLDFSIDLIEQWGLHYRGLAFVWIKTKKDGSPIGAQGVRPSIVKPLTELVLAASMVKKGRPLKLSSESVVQTVFAPKREHSRKPDEVMDRIEQLYPNATKLEMFSRQNRVGWDTMGDEVGKYEQDGQR